MARTGSGKPRRLLRQQRALPWVKIDKAYVFDGHDECRLPLSRPDAAGTPRRGVAVPHGLAAAARSIYARARHRRLLPDIMLMSAPVLKSITQCVISGRVSPEGPQ